MENNVSEKILQQIRTCMNLSHRLMHAEHRNFDNRQMLHGAVGRGQGLVLHILSENDGLTQSEITEKLDIRPSSLGELVSKLEKNGYVERRQNENDKRVINVFLTEKGREAEKEFINPRQKAAEQWFSGLSDDEKTKLSEILGKLISTMESIMDKNEEKYSNMSDAFEAFGALPNRMGHHRGMHCHGGHSEKEFGGNMREFRCGFRF